MGDSLTKWASRKVLLQFFAGGQKWKLIHDPKFESGRKVRKKELERLLKERQDSFLAAVEKMAYDCRYPWDPHGEDLRGFGDESLGMNMSYPFICEPSP